MSALSIIITDEGCPDDRYSASIRLHGIISQMFTDFNIPHVMLDWSNCEFALVPNHLWI